MQEICIPFLTEFDPVTTSEGSLDPLGLYPIADSLAERLAPGVRERQSHPRFLTAIAVASLVCSNFDEDIIAKDGISEPWQVFEWYLVEGLVRTMDDTKEIQQLPGRDKAAIALRDRLPLSASRYLKTPTVFGFHGVYRILATNLDIIDRAGRLGETGYRLVKTWEAEQGLVSFCSGDTGKGADARRDLYKAVQKGLEESTTARSGGWSGWWFFKEYLTPLKCGKKEAELLASALHDTRFNFRRQAIEYLCSQKGRKIWQDTESERAFHEGLKAIASSDLKLLLDAILGYETFSRIVQDAFEDCLLFMSRKSTKVTPKEIAKLEEIKTAQKKVHDLFMEVSSLLEPFNESTRFEMGFSALADKVATEEWIEALTEHHYRIQKNKPPNGKNPWFWRLDDGSVIIRPEYRTDKGGAKDGSYLHYYRTRPLWSFARG